MVLKHKSDARKLTLSMHEQGVIRTLTYFDIFSYPLTEQEIQEFHPQEKNLPAIKASIERLVSLSFVFKLGNFYSLRRDPDLVPRRLEGNRLARKRLGMARVFGKLISRFPFVRGVMLSGSISKNFMDESSDIDYFIVTKPGRLWLTRGLLAIFKRLFLLNSHKFFCTNYFIDTESLEIEEKNLYTAMELSTLIPVYGKDVYQQLLIRNHWIRNHLPNYRPQDGLMDEIEVNAGQQVLEKIFSWTLGEKLNKLFFQLAVKRWDKKYRNRFSPEDFMVAFKSKENVSKNHPRLFQKNTLESYYNRVRQFELTTKLKLSA